jgi:ketosteroid isomerase-like protein
MGSEDVKLVRRLFEAWNRNDWDEMAAAFDENVVGVPPEGWPEAGEPVSDSKALMRQFERLKDSWEEEHVDVKDIREEGEEIVVDGIWVTRGQNSGIELQVPVTVRASVSGGRITRAQFNVEDAASRPPDRR